MDKRKLRLVLLGLAGAIILVIGIGAAAIYLGTCPEVVQIQENYAQAYGYDTWSELPKDLQGRFYELRPDLRSPGLVHKNARFTSWFITWVVRPLGLFVILTAALVVSRVISNKLRPPSNPD